MGGPGFVEPGEDLHETPYVIEIMKNAVAKGKPLRNVLQNSSVLASLTPLPGFSNNSCGAGAKRCNLPDVLPHVLSHVCSHKTSTTRLPVLYFVPRHQRARVAKEDTR